jgi:hypothetical protein
VDELVAAGDFRLSKDEIDEVESFLGDKS